MKCDFVPSVRDGKSLSSDPTVAQGGQAGRREASLGLDRRAVKVPSRGHLPTEDRPGAWEGVAALGGQQWALRQAEWGLGWPGSKFKSWEPTCASAFSMFVSLGLSLGAQ